MKIYTKSALCTLVISALISCSTTDQSAQILKFEPDVIPHLMKHNVVMTNGFDFNTGKMVTIDPFTGKEVNPCGTMEDIHVSGNSADKTPNNTQNSPHTGGHRDFTGCNTQIVDANPTLKDALKISALPEPMEGTVRVDGIDKPAKFIITVTALYPGSHCSTTFSGGVQLTSCISREARCAALKAIGISC
jgi:hypothetical protein